MTATGALPDTHLPKANRVMRALRRAVLAFWYTTIEDVEAATIEAATAAYWVNVLDEAVLEPALGEPYRSYEPTTASDEWYQWASSWFATARPMPASSPRRFS